MQVADVEPLRGCRVLDLTTFLSGPLVGRAVADLGAEVIKIEPPTGDPTRPKPGEPWQSLWLQVHRGRKSVVLDLKNPAGRNVLLELVKHADVLLENFRPGVMDRFDLSPDTVRAVNDRLIYVTITGFGPDGPVAQQVSIDGPVQAFSGSIELADLNGVDPLPMPITVADIAGASAATTALLGALLSRERTGKGTHVDVSLFESLLPWVFINRRAALAQPVTQMAEGSDGGRFIVQTPMHFHDRLRELVGTQPGFESFATDPRFANRDAAKEHADDYTATLQKAFASRTRDEWLADLKRVGIPSGPVHGIDEAMAHPQLDHRNATAEVPNRDRTPARFVLSPYRFDGERRTAAEEPPELGAHTTEVLQTVLGYGDREMDDLAAQGAFGRATG